MRNKRPWEKAVPELADTTSTVFTLRSPQNVTISPHNCPEGGDQIATAIRTAGSR